MGTTDTVQYITDQGESMVVVYICNNCNMGTRDLLDMYARSPRAEGIHIRQIMSTHVTSNNVIITSGTLKITQTHS